MDIRKYREIKEFCQENRLIQPGDGIVVGLSGGADSVYLTLFLDILRHELSLQIQLVHVHHGIRGREADQDAAYCEKLADRLGLSLEIVYRDIPALAREQRRTEEETGRIERYAVFEKIRNERHFQHIAVAHHQEDQAETVLFQLARGSSLRGMGAMRSRQGYVIRPLLCIRRIEIERELCLQQIAWCEDATNQEDAYARNRVRHHILPQMESLSPAAVEHIAQTADQLQEVYQYIDLQTKQQIKEMVTERHNGVEMSAQAYNRLPGVIQRELAIQCMERVAGRRKDLTRQHIASFVQLAEGETGKRISLPYGMIAGKDYDCLWLCENRETTSMQDIYTIPQMELQEGQILLPSPTNTLRIVWRCQNREKLGEEVPKNNCTKWFDYATIKNSLSFRHPESGDYLWIDGEGKRKKLNRFLIDQKVPVEQRKILWVLAMGNHILWIPEFGRVSEMTYVTAETRQVLQMVMEEID